MESVPAKQIGRVRWRLPVILLVSVVIAYFDRLNISLALPKIAEEFGWSAGEINRGGLLMSIFFVGYGLANIFLSPLGEHFGARKGLFAAVISFSVFTILGAFVGQIFSLFVATRLLLGLGEGIHFPMNSKLTKNWFPTNERSRANGIWTAGIIVATFLAPLCLIPIIDHYGWRMMFLFIGCAGLFVTLPLIYFACWNTPREHPRISAAEQDYIAAGMEAETPVVGSFWGQVRPFLIDRRYWVALLAGIGNNFTGYGLLMWFPIYFTRGKGLEYENLRYALPAQYGFGILGIALWSWLGDRTQRRVLMAGFGYLAATILAWRAVSASSIPATVAFFSAAIFFQMSYIAQEYAILQHILPKERIAAGTGLYNGLAVLIGGGLGSWIIGETIARTGNFDSGIGVIIGVAACTTVVNLILSRLIKY